MNKDKIFKLAKGFRGRAKNCIRIARERVEKALQYSYRDRRNKKRDMRSLWIQRINAGTRQHGVCISLFLVVIHVCFVGSIHLIYCLYCFYVEMNMWVFELLALTLSNLENRSLHCVNRNWIGNLI